MEHYDDDGYLDAEFTYNINQMLAFCNGTFGAYDLPSNPSPWTCTFPNEFYSYIKAIAYPDVLSGKWHDLLCNADELEMLATGILWRVLDQEVLSDLLFGASEAQKQVLAEQDREFIDLDGTFAA